MPSDSVEEWMDRFLAECEIDNEPADVPSRDERQAVSDYLQGRIAATEAAFAYTRDTIAEKTTGDVWFLICHMVQHLPETHDRLIELIRAISMLPNEPRANGSIKEWNHSLVDLQGELRDYWDGQSDLVRVNSAVATKDEYINLTTFISRLCAERMIHSQYFSQVVMYITLEQEEEARVLDAYLLAATRYLELMALGVLEESRGVGMSPGSLLRTAMDLGDVTRWQFWKLRLAVLGEQQDVKQESRNAAKRSLIRMIEVETTAT
ncbi:MAG: hypothetical protein Q9222_000952 [Ikaeria aurantiellina]